MKTNKQDFQKMEDKTFIINLEIPKEKIEKEYQETLKSIQADFEIKGFRKGKVPFEIVKEHVSMHQIMKEMTSCLISHAYSDKIKELELKPIIQPKIEIKNPPVSLDKNWEIEITGCELPEIKLDEKYLELIKKINTAENKEEDKSKVKENKLNQIFDTLLKSAKLNLPAILIESDIENRLSQLVEQISQAGITVDQFLKNKKQTIDQYKEELKNEITKEWTLNLAIDQIAKDQKIEIKPENAKEFLTKNPQLASNMNMVYYFLIQQKVFDYLENLK